MTLSIKSISLFILATALVVGLGYSIYILNKDLFFGIGWFLIFTSIITPLTSRLSRTSIQMLVYLCVLMCGIIWFLVNDTLFQIISTNINSNPYGEYVLSQFEFRLTLSIFVIKIILKTWLTDMRLITVGLLLLANILICPRLYKLFFQTLSARFFEFIVATFSHIKIDTGRYLATSLILAVVNGTLWCLAGFLLQFDNFIPMTFIMVICSFIPHSGLFLAASLSLLFVETGLYLIQFGGLLIAVASIWFVDHTIFRDQQDLVKYIPVLILMLFSIAGYLLFSVLGLFMSAPLGYVAAVISANIEKNTNLIHKIPRPAPRKA